VYDTAGPYHDDSYEVDINIQMDELHNFYGFLLKNHYQSIEYDDLHNVQRLHVLQSMHREPLEVQEKAIKIM
jgi:hypothetical protein